MENRKFTQQIVSESIQETHMINDQKNSSAVENSPQDSTAESEKKKKIHRRRRLPSW